MNTLAGRGWRSQTWWIGKLIRFHTKRLRECRRGGATEYHRCPLPHTVVLNSTASVHALQPSLAMSSLTDNITYRMLSQTPSSCSLHASAAWRPPRLVSLETDTTP